jgi:hypothetical protein
MFGLTVQHGDMNLVNLNLMNQNAVNLMNP